MINETKLLVFCTRRIVDSFNQCFLYAVIIHINPEHPALFLLPCINKNKDVGLLWVLMSVQFLHQIHSILFVIKYILTNRLLSKTYLYYFIIIIIIIIIIVICIFTKQFLIGNEILKAEFLYSFFLSCERTNHKRMRSSHDIRDSIRIIF